MGAWGRERVQAKRGITERVTKEIWDAYALGVVDPPHPLIARMFFGSLSFMANRTSDGTPARSRLSQRELETPVMRHRCTHDGRSRKSPMVAHLAKRLRQAGRDPAHPHAWLSPQIGRSRGDSGARPSPPSALTGDEAQIFLRGGDAHVGIGKNRYAVGVSMERQLRPDIFVLDDGFQHEKLARKHDIVLIDALYPLAGGVFPLGERRECLEALRRATILVVTRSEPGVPITGLEMLLRPYNTEAPIFRSWVRPLEWVDAATGETLPAGELGVKRVAAFCGLGNPRSFWKTLEGSGLDVAFRWAFGDHHSYRPGELHRLSHHAEAAGAEALVTTEKDFLNLFEGAADVIAPLKLYWLRIGIEIENEEALLRLLL